MKPSARIQSVIELLERIEEQSRVPMDTISGDYFRNRRYIGSKDRAITAQRVYDIMRARARLGWWLDHAQHPDSPRARAIAFLLLSEACDEKRLDKDLFDGSQYAPAELDDAEKKLVSMLAGQSLNHADMPASIRVECPADYETALKQYFGKDFETEMAAMIPSAPLDLRVNMWLSDRAKVKAALAKDDVETAETPLSPTGLRAQNKIYLSKTKAFNKGLVEIQDEGSQMIAHVCDVQPGMQVLDYCAGAGGKTLALAAAMQRKGRIVAMDNDEKRLARGRERFKKAQVSDIIEPRPLSDERHRKWLRRQKETFDVVLIDVPCSGTGTWRRNPDMRWKLYGPKLPELQQVQSEILEKVAGAVKPGGRLVYATCSLLPGENEEQVAKFLENHPEFSVKPVDAKLGNPYMRLTPHRHNTDGFFAAVLEKKAS